MRVLQGSQLQVQAVAEGFDPTLGIMHHGRRDAPAYVFDLMEPERPKVDAAILAFVAEHTFSGGDFTIREDSISPDLAVAYSWQEAGCEGRRRSRGW